MSVTSFRELRNESHRTSHAELNKATHQKRNPHQFCESPFSPKMPRSSAVIILFVEVSSNSAQHREELPMNVNPAAVVGPQSYQTYDSHGGRRFPPLRINNDRLFFGTRRHKCENNYYSTSLSTNSGHNARNFCNFGVSAFVQVTKQTE